mmetsp:Transcript_4055/g.12311  ORF Transcript_4055/g.12311 Transcript_4055/m.12311 type:complete len:205 (-) Transcript_4055:640-1254(-)
MMRPFDSVTSARAWDSASSLSPTEPPGEGRGCQGDRCPGKYPDATAGSFGGGGGGFSSNCAGCGCGAEGSTGRRFSLPATILLARLSRILSATSFARILHDGLSAFATSILTSSKVRRDLAKSAAKGALTSWYSWLMSGKPSRQACKKMRGHHMLSVEAVLELYLGSLTSGCPIALMWIRIWCVRPEMMTMRQSENTFFPPLSL